MALSDFHIPNAGSATNPALTFGDDLDSGLYSVGPNVVGLAANGVKVGEINSLGVLNGVAGTDYRNLVKSSFLSNPFSSNFTSVLGTSVTSTGLNFSYTPSYTTSRIKIDLSLPIYVAGASQANTVTIFLYVTTSPLTSGIASPVTGAYATPINGLLGADISSSNGSNTNNMVFWYLSTGTTLIYFNVLYQNRLTSTSTLINHNSASVANRNSVIIEEYI